MRYGAKWPVYAKEWDNMRINPSRQAEFEHIAAHLVSNKARYEAVEHWTGVPWYMVAVLHLRESDADFSTYLGNGDPLKHKTTHVPRGRGPFATFLDGAIDALKYDGLTGIQDWRLEKILYHAELYNGAGYFMHGLPSPYLWGGTNIQKPGKYTSDGHWNPNIMDNQPGIVPIIAEMAKLDPTIAPRRED